MYMCTDTDHSRSMSSCIACAFSELLSFLKVQSYFLISPDCWCNSAWDWLKFHLCHETARGPDVFLLWALTLQDHSKDCVVILNVKAVTVNIACLVGEKNQESTEQINDLKPVYLWMLHLCSRKEKGQGETESAYISWLLSSIHLTLSKIFKNHQRAQTDSLPILMKPNQDTGEQREEGHQSKWISSMVETEKAILCFWRFLSCLMQRSWASSSSSTR